MAAKEIYHINVERRGICNKSHYVSLIQCAVVEAIERADAGANSERDSARDAEVVAWAELDQARQIITDLVEYAECNDPKSPHLARAQRFLIGDHD